ncbi:MAG: small-conductance mechanosensitive channel [Burkholderiales bacterium]|jgi:flagellar biosynthesis protein FliQ|nr:small-conductance mechanosensitive channel [Burkholderiales bacterium]
MDRVDMMLEPVRVFLVQIGHFLPKLALAVVVLIAGWMLAKLARFTIIKALRAINFNVLTERAGMDGFLRQGGVQSDTTEIFGVLIYWLVILAALVIAFNSLGLTYITDLLRQVVLFVPKVIVALLILAFGAYFARFVGGTVMTYCRNVGIQDGELLGSLAQYAIMTFVVLIALEQVNVGGEIVRLSFLIILGGAVFALALAFGLGSQAKVAQLLERWWPSDRDADRP